MKDDGRCVLSFSVINQQFFQGTRDQRRRRLRVPYCRYRARQRHRQSGRTRERQSLSARGCYRLYVQGTARHQALRWSGAASKPYHIRHVQSRYAYKRQDLGMGPVPIGHLVRDRSPSKRNPSSRGWQHKRWPSLQCYLFRHLSMRESEP